MADVRFHVVWFQVSLVVVVLVPVTIIMMLVVAIWSIVVMHSIMAVIVLVMRPSVMIRSDAADCGHRKCGERG